MKNSIEINVKMGCGNSCVYCPQDVLVASYLDDVKILTLETFKKILENVDPCKTEIIFSGFSEPFLVSNAEDMMIFAYLHGYDVSLYTTLQGFTDSKSKKLSESGIIFSQVYFHEFNGKNFNYEKFLEKKDKFKNEVKSFVFKEIKPELSAGSRAGALWDVPKKIGSLKCNSNRYFANVVLPNGDLYLCCCDWKLKHKIGNIFEGHYDSFNNERFKIIDMCINEDDSDVLCRYCEESNPGVNIYPYRKSAQQMEDDKNNL